jgi:drug/metabolite transporter (DMT)-like permease
MVGAMALLAAADGVAKELGRHYPLWEVVWARYAFNLLALAPALIRQHPPGELWPARPALQLARGAALLVSSALYFAALVVMPLADTLALTFVAPLVVAALAPWLLGESVGWRTYAAVTVGFAGTLLIARPGSGVLHAGALLALGAGASYGLFLIATRRLAGTAPPLVTLGWTAGVGTLATSAILPFAWQPPGAVDLALMAALGAGAALAHLLMIRAFASAPAALLAPLSYLEIVGAAAVGYVAFGDFPDVPTWLGAGVIVASGLVVSLGERDA